MAATVFWIGVALLLYTYVGYPLLLGALWLLGRRVQRPAADPSHTPNISIILAVRNEGERIGRRLHNLLTQDYPDDCLEVVVASDGSTDTTDAKVREIAAQDDRVRLVSCSAAGKAAALNIAVQDTGGEILVFADARQSFARTAIKRLAAVLSSPDVGAVSGRLQLRAQSEHAEIGVRTYWRMESWIRRMEARVSSSVSVTGSIYAARRTAMPRIPPGTILDDLYVPMSMVLEGWRVEYEPSAVAYDLESATFREEFQRKVRTLRGNYQLLQLLPSVLNPIRNPLFLQLVSHKLLRLGVPFVLIAIFLANLQLSGTFFSIFLAAQTLLYVVGVVGIVSTTAREWLFVRTPAAFLVLNAAAVIALLQLVRGREQQWR